MFSKGFNFRVVKRRDGVRKSESKTKQALIFTCVQYKYFETTVGKGESALNEQFLLYPQCFLPLWRTFCHFHQIWAPPGWLSSECVRLMNWWLRAQSSWGDFFFPAYFCLSPLQKHVRKVVGGFGKKSFVSTGVRKPGNTYASPTAMIWP